MENAKEVLDIIFYWCGVWLAMNSITVACVKVSAALRKRARRRYMVGFIARELRSVAAAPETEKSDEHQEEEAARNLAEAG